jgi:hypothetical protein
LHKRLHPWEMWWFDWIMCLQWWLHWINVFWWDLRYCLFQRNYPIVEDTPSDRALPDITSGPEVRQIFKIRTLRKPDILLPRRRTFNSFKKKKIQKIFSKKILIFFFQDFFFLNTSQFIFFDTKFVSRDLIIW